MSTGHNFRRGKPVLHWIMGHCQSFCHLHIKQRNQCLDKYAQSGRAARIVLVKILDLHLIEQGLCSCWPIPFKIDHSSIRQCPWKLIHLLCPLRYVLNGSSCVSLCVDADACADTGEKKGSLSFK